VSVPALHRASDAARIAATYCGSRNTGILDGIDRAAQRTRSVVSPFGEESRSHRCRDVVSPTGTGKPDLGIEFGKNISIIASAVGSVHSAHLKPFPGEA
jgi:hypothetical protein